MRGAFALLGAVLALGGMSAPSPVAAQEAPRLRGSVDLAGRQIAAVELSSVFGTDAAFLRARTHFKRGQRFDPAAVRRTVQALYGTGRFSSVQIFARLRPDGRVTVVVDVVPRTTIREIRFQHAGRVSEIRLRNRLRVRPGDTFYADQVVARVAELRELFSEAGFPRARLTPDAEPGEEGRTVNLVITVDEGTPARIAELRFVGRLGFPEKRLTDAFEMEIGDITDREKLGRATLELKDWFKQRGYLEADVNAPEITLREDGNADVRIPVESGPEVRIRVYNNRRYKTSVLLEAARAREQDVYEGKNIEAIAGRLKVFYQNRGFFHVKVQSRARRSRDGRRKLIEFRIEEGEQSWVHRMRFVGVRELSTKELESQVRERARDALTEISSLETLDNGDIDDMGLSGRDRPWDKHKGRPTLLDIPDDEILAPEAYGVSQGVVRDLYLSRGYRRAEAEGPEIAEILPGARLMPRYQVREGIQTQVARIELSGNENFGEGTLREALGFEPGEPLTDLAVEQGRRRLLELYGRRGFAYAKIEAETEYLDTAGRQARVAYVIDERTRVYVSQVRVRGNGRTRSRVVRDAAGIETGAELDLERLRRRVRKVDQLGTFRRVAMDIVDPDTEEEEKDILIDVEERLVHNHDLRLGVSTEDGLRGRYRYRHLNLFGYALQGFAELKLNYQVFLGLLEFTYPAAIGRAYREQLESLRFDERLERRVNVGVNYPRIFGLGGYDFDAGARIDLLHERDNRPAFSVTRYALRPNFSVGFGRLTLFLSYELELTDVETNPKVIDELIDEERRRLPPDGEAVVSTIRPVWIYEARDNPVNPTSGYYLSGSAEYARSVGIIANDLPVNLFKLELLASAYASLDVRTRPTLALQIGYGQLFHPFSSFNDLPLNKRLYLGGATTLRGFPQDLLIPQEVVDECRQIDCEPDELLARNGGSAYLLMRGEVRLQVIGNFSVAFFTDTGNLWQQADNMDPTQLRVGAGGSLRYLTPVGPLALDLAYNLDPRDAVDERQRVFYFSVGVF